tara:strand:- start:4353 stop:4676 length:324 start_codon:yes stop_codon:yes gene_type:complete
MDRLRDLINVIAKGNQRKENLDFGLNGLDIVNGISGDQTVAGNWVAVKVDNTGTTGAHFTTLTTAEGDALDGVKLAPGDILYAPITNAVIASAATDCLVMFYRRHKE